MSRNNYPKKPVRKGTGWQTAKTRWEGVAAPIKWLLENADRPNRDIHTILDYGCGRGQDAQTMGWQKYDPNWFPEHPLSNPLIEGGYDFIYCIYVLNVLPDPEDRAFIIGDIRRLLNDSGVGYIAIRADMKIDKVKHQIRINEADHPDLQVIETNSRFLIWKVMKHG